MKIKTSEEIRRAARLEATPHETENTDTGTIPPDAHAKQGREIYFDFNRGNYWTQNEHGGWILLNETQIKRMLKACGVSPDRVIGKFVSNLDITLLDIQSKCDVHYAGSLAGYHSGIHTVNEKRILVTESPQLVIPEQGEWPTLAKMIEGLLVDGNCDQRPYFYGWLKVTLEALHSRKLRPGQTLALCGPHDCGKSLLQNLITILLGGRAAKPYQFMAGQTPFNADLFEAEHLQIEDDQSSTDIRARRNFGASIKAFCVNESHRLHDKGRRAVNGLKPFWRVTITVNDEPENLMVLPPLDDSLEDKLMLLRAFKRPMPMPTDSNEERAAFWGTLVNELPAFVHFLMAWTIPVHLRSSRFGVTDYHHPELVQAIDSLAPEQKLLLLMDGELFATPAPGGWRGTAAELETRLTSQDSRCAHEARKLFSWPSACGVYLGRLAKRIPARIAKDEGREDNFRRWTIHPPS